MRCRRGVRSGRRIGEGRLPEARQPLSDSGHCRRGLCDAGRGLAEILQRDGSQLRRADEGRLFARCRSSANSLRTMATRTAMAQPTAPSISPPSARARRLHQGRAQPGHQARSQPGRCRRRRVAPGRKLVGVVLYPGFEVLDVFGPVEMWAYVPDFQVVMISQDGGAGAIGAGCFDRCGLFLRKRAAARHHDGARRHRHAD